MAIATALLGTEVTGFFKESTPFTLPAAMADQQGLCIPGSLHHEVLPCEIGALFVSLLRAKGPGLTATK